MSSWTCISQRDNKVDYKINLLQSSCSLDSCHLKCPYMDCKSLCRHMYTCECPDYANGHICKHLHGLCMWLESFSSNSSTSYSDMGKVNCNFCSSY